MKNRIDCCDISPPQTQDTSAQSFGLPTCIGWEVRRSDCCYLLKSDRAWTRGRSRLSHRCDKPASTPQIPLAEVHQSGRRIQRLSLSNLRLRVGTESNNNLTMLIKWRSEVPVWSSRQSCWYLLSSVCSGGSSINDSRPRPGL